MNFLHILFLHIPQGLWKNFRVKNHLYFLVIAQESIKEGAIGEALCAELPLVKSALSYVPLPAALGFRWSNLTSILCRGKMSRFLSGSSARCGGGFLRGRIGSKRPLG